MKQNNILKKIDDNKNIDQIELRNLYNLVMLKYPGEFKEKEAKRIAELLYINNIKPFMFFESEFDIDEIVYYIASKIKIIKFCQKKEYHLENEIINNENTNNGQIIKFNKYLKATNKHK